MRCVANKGDEMSYSQWIVYQLPPWLTCTYWKSSTCLEGHIIIYEGNKNMSLEIDAIGWGVWYPSENCVCKSTGHNEL